MQPKLCPMMWNRTSGPAAFISAPEQIVPRPLAELPGASLHLPEGKGPQQAEHAAEPEVAEADRLLLLDGRVHGLRIERLAVGPRLGALAVGPHPRLAVEHRAGTGHLGRQPIRSDVVDRPGDDHPQGLAGGRRIGDPLRIGVDHRLHHGVGIPRRHPVGGRRGRIEREGTVPGAERLVAER